MTTTVSSAPARARLSAALPGVLYFLILAALLGVYGTLLIWRPISGFNDFWAHAAVGRWIWENGRVPDQTLYLWTATIPWVYHSWLSELLIFCLTRLVSTEDLPIVVESLTVLAGLLAFAIAWLLWWRSGRLSSWLVIPFVLALQVSWQRVQPRPELFTELFVALLLLFLIAWRRSDGGAGGHPARRGRLLAGAALVAVFVLWTNLHGGVILGLVLLALTAGCDLLQDRFDGPSRLLTVFALVAVAATCLNPYGVGYWETYRSVRSETFAHIKEWAPIWDASVPISPGILWRAAVLAALALLAWAMNPRRRWAQLGWLLVTAALFVQARRNVWPFTIACLFVLAANAAAIDPELLWRKASGMVRARARRKTVQLPGDLRWIIRLGLLAWLALELAYTFIWFRPWRPMAPYDLEQGIVRFLHDHPMSGRVFNTYENSSYLQWRLAGQPPLYIDPLNAYPDQVMRDYWNLARMTPTGHELIAEQELGVVVLCAKRPATAWSMVALADFLDAQADWIRVYADDDGVIWVRRTPEYEHIWQPLVGKVRDVKWAVLEDNGDENQVLSPAPPGR